MNWTLHEDGIVRKTGQSACFAATAAEKEFWARIQELELALTEIDTRTRLYPPNKWLKLQKKL